ncbi:hypothetical protein CSA56_05605 [candidate division KSB3 bacterium]|uniref:Chemotaxis protein CheA n=1 Tax=candidate division KSB3 bacterium TaxID=2044937 RepID=A0A2G6KI70_9BACT|nr:MAG: hypothetical protein CSA56_05605 [candidate division KSB3 bacterium]
MATINRDFFIAQYREEANDHIQHITRRLFQLEEQPGNQTQLLEEIFRIVHTLKGSSRMMGYTDISDLAHKIEDFLVEIRDGHLDIYAEVTDLLFYCLDTLNYLVEGLAKHVNRTVDIEQFTKLFQDILAGKSIEVPHFQTQLAEPAPATDMPSTSPMPQQGRIDETEERHHIRVHTDELDSILNLVGELIINQYRCDGQQAACAKIAHDLHEHQQIITELQDVVQQEKETALIARLTHIIDRLDRSSAGITLQAKHFLKKHRTDRQQMRLAINHLQEHVIDIRMVPASRIFHLFPRLVRMTARRLDKKIELRLQGEETKIDSRIIEEMRDPLIHLLQNAIYHGIEASDKRQSDGKNPTGTIIISARQEGSRIILTVQDDGRGIDMAAIRDYALKEGLLSHKNMHSVTEQEVFDYLFEPGFSTSDIVDDIAGRGFGLDIVRTHVDRVHGEIEVRSSPGKGAKFILKLPLTLTIVDALLVRDADDVFAIPTMAVEKTFDLLPEEIEHLGTMPAVVVHDTLLPIVALRHILNISSSQIKQRDPDQTFIQKPERKTVIILQAEDRRIGFLVDDLVEERKIVIKHLGSCLKRVRNVAGATTIRGDVVIILSVRDLIRSAEALLEDRSLTAPFVSHAPNESETRAMPPQILLIDDSPNTREVERMILEQAGYAVLMAENGEQGLEMLQKHSIQLVITDVEMPEMDGLTFTKTLKRDDTFRDIAVIIVSTRGSDADRQAGLEAGADAYIVKGEFDEKHLLNMIASCLKRFTKNF